MLAVKKGKSIDLNKATVALAKKEEKGKVWITITTSSKKKREIAAKSKDDADQWVARLTQAAAGAGAATPTVNKEPVKEEKPAKVDTKVKEEKKDVKDKDTKKEPEAETKVKDDKKYKEAKKRARSCREGHKD